MWIAVLQTLPLRQASGIIDVFAERLVADCLPLADHAGSDSKLAVGKTGGGQREEKLSV